MGTPSKDLIETEGTLRTVISALVDSQQGLQKIGEALRDESLKRSFFAESLKRAEFRGELENILHQEGISDVQEKGTAAGSFVRVWTELKSALGASDQTLIASATEAEDSLRLAYVDALDKFLPGPIRETLLRQGAVIQEAYAFLQAAATSRADA